jgi:intron-binding protein aquarius
MRSQVPHLILLISILLPVDVLLSLVRTKAVGHVRDVRRLVVALSRARLGLYIFGRQKLFENCHELEPAFKRLLKYPTKLWLKTGEMYPNTVRIIGAEAKTDGEEEAEASTKAGKKGGKKDKKSTKKGKAGKADAEAAGEEESKSGEASASKDYEIQDIDQMGEYVFGMMKEQQQYAIQQQQAYLQSISEPMETESVPAAGTEGDGAMEVDQE